jgi:hypothetical protein
MGDKGALVFAEGMDTKKTVKEQAFILSQSFPGSADLIVIEFYF